MTTNKLIEKYGIGHNCLSDAYALGMADGLDVLEHAIEKARAEAIDEFKNKLIELYHKRYMHDIYLDDIDSIVEQLKEQKDD